MTDPARPAAPLAALFASLLRQVKQASREVQGELYSGSIEDTLFLWRYHRKRIEARLTQIEEAIGEKKQ